MSAGSLERKREQVKEFIAIISNEEGSIAKTGPVVLRDRQEFIQYLAKRTPAEVALFITLGLVKLSIQERDLDLSIVE